MKKDSYRLTRSLDAIGDSGHDHVENYNLYRIYKKHEFFLAKASKEFLQSNGINTAVNAAGFLMNVFLNSRESNRIAIHVAAKKRRDKYQKRLERRNKWAIFAKVINQ